MNKLLLSVITFIISLSLVACDASAPIPTTNLPQITTQPTGLVSFAITSPVNGLLSRTNVIKVEGTVPNGASSVTVNGKPAKVLNNAFLAFIELAEGQNTIEAMINASGTVLTTKSEVSFVRPLAVFLTDEIELGVDYLVTALTVTGYVTLPQASVTVDGTQVAVQADGTFKAEVMANQPTDLISATAVLGTETDTVTITLLFWDGQLGPGPSYPFDNRFAELLLDRSISVTRGAETTSEFTLKPNRNIASPQSCRFIVPGTGGGSLPVGLSFEFYPESFTAYPNAVYNLMVSVSASKDISPGIYPLLFEASFAGGTGIIVPIAIEVR